MLIKKSIDNFYVPKHRIDHHAYNYIYIIFKTTDVVMPYRANPKGQLKQQLPHNFIFY